MDIDIRTIDADEYADALIDAIYDDPQRALALNFGHANIHYMSDKCEQEMLTRMIREDKTQVSVFLNQEEAIDLILNAAVFRADDIAGWMTEDRRFYDNPKDYHELVITAPMHENTGLLLNDKLKEYEADSVRLVLRRDYTDAPFGFRVETAYPVLENEKTATPIKELNRKEIALTNEFIFESTMQKAAFLTSGHQGIHVSDLSKQDPPEIMYQSRQGEVRYLAYVKENDMKIQRIDKATGERSNITPLQLEKEHPAMASVLKEATYYVRGEEPAVKTHTVTHGDDCSL